MNAAELEVHNLNVDLIRPFISRARGRTEFEEMRDAIAETGCMPIQVRDISDWPAKDRVRPEGGHYRYELIVGEGRLTAAKELGWKTIPALIKNAPESEIAGRFLAENMIRRPLPWAVKARLVKAELDRGIDRKTVAKRHFISEAHLAKMERILSKSAKGLEEEIARLPMNEAEVLTTLPAEDQTIVIAVLREKNAVEGNVAAVVAKAEALKKETGALTKAGLQASLVRVQDDLKGIREQLKAKRLHHSLGPGNLETLLQDAAFRKALKAAGVSTEQFESTL